MKHECPLDIHDPRFKSFRIDQCDLTWNQLEAGVLNMHEKLVELGFTYRDGKAVIVEARNK